MSGTPEGNTPVEDPLDLLVTVEDDNTEDQEAVSAESEEEPEGLEEAQAEAEDPEEEAEEEEEEQLYAVWNPETEEVDQVDFESLKKYGLRQSDYTRKMQSMADDRTALEAKQAEVERHRTQLMDTLATWAVQGDQEPDWVALAQQLPPQQYQVEQAAWQQRKAKSDQAREMYHQLKAEAGLEQATREKELLLNALPEWRDEAVAQKGAEAVAKLAMDAGFTPEEIQDPNGPMSDHRVVLFLNRIVNLQALEQSNAAEAKKVAKTPQTMPPGARTSRKSKAAKAEKAAMDRFRKSGSIEDFANLL